MENVQQEVEIPKSKGQLFKEKTGYSKTMKRLMKKHQVSTVEEYRSIRKNAKKEAAAKIKSARLKKAA